MKYRIVGADGKIYGPVGLEQVRQWLAQGRAEGRTPVYVEGASGWTYLALLPELAAEFSTPPPAIGAIKSGPAAAGGTNGFATAGLVCSLLAWVCCCCPFNLLGLIFSIIALAQISSQPEPRQEGRVFAIIGLVLSGANLLFVFALSLVQMALGSTSINWQTGPFQ
jgi:hypothetical protein